MVNEFRIELIVEVSTNKTRLVPQGPDAFLGGRNLHLQDSIVSTCIYIVGTGVITSARRESVRQVQQVVLFLEVVCS